MLSVEPALRKRRTRRKFGLALAGGGPLGAFYQIGALHALSECTEGLDLTALDVYVGVSSGAIIAASLANGLTTEDMGRAFFAENASDEFLLTPGVVMRPAAGEYITRLLTVPALVGQVITRWARNPFNQSWAEALSPLASAIPIGVFDNHAFERYLRRLLSSDDRTNDFRKLKQTLRIVATDLNSGTEVCFGEKGLDHIPISEAIRASTALPGLYTPAKIEGRTYVDGALLRTMHASLALEKGCDLVIAVNPLVTFDASQAKRNGRHHDLAAAGLSAVMGQTFRALIQSRMQIGMANYRQRYPHADRLLLEPDRHDEDMFFANLFRYSERRRLANHAYQATRRDLLAHERDLAPVLKRHGIRLREDRLRERHRTFHTGIEAAGVHALPVAKNLATTLDRLSSYLQAAS
ncbi:MAG TPA: patatin-like phospholipase family protein [Steroidobacteraceae bacterium]|nr:patatin-like phospholipase family protein [Steroidobacteraceae bacterium]